MRQERASEQRSKREEQAFLYQVMRHYYEADGDEIYLRQIILPNKRAAIFAQKYLASMTDKPLFAPRLRTIEDFVHNLAPDYTVLDQTALLLELYDSYVQVMSESGDYRSFEDFVYWGRIILSDFDLIDRHCIQPRQIFRNIFEYKELEDTFEHLDDETKEVLAQFFQSSSLSFSASKGGEDSYRERYLHFWESLGRIYEHFTESLWQRHLCYEGQIYRYVAEHAGEIADALEERQTERGERPIAFVGLFDISPSEMKLFKTLQRRGLAEFCWDEQVYILTPQASGRATIEHPALRIHNENKATLSGVSGSWTEVGGRKFLPRRIEKIQCSSTIAQAKILPDLLVQMGFAPEAEAESLLEVAIILPDESMLLPAVGAIPPEYQRLNVTLGYPLDYTPVAVIINRWRQMILSSKTQGVFAVGAILSFVSHQFLTRYFPVLRGLSRALRNQNSYFISSSWLISTYGELYEEAIQRGDVVDVSDPSGQSLQRDIAHLVFSDDLTAEPLLSGIQSLLEHIIAQYEEELALRRELEQDEADTLFGEGESSEQAIGGDSSVSLSIFDAEFVHHYLRLINRLRGLLSDFGLQAISAQATLDLLTELGGGIQIPFDGDPLEGLQIMGLLYSRLLHFPKLIYLSSEDANLSRSSMDSSLIPYVLRLGFGLPRPDQQDAVLAYRFYQSIAHADELYMIYTSDDDGAEESRYLLQLEYLYGVPVERRRVELYPNLAGAYAEPRALTPTIQVKKEGWVRDELEKYFSPPSGDSKGYNSLSPTSLAEYVKCPLKFYYTRIARLREEDEPKELMEDNKLGDIFHKVMEEIYAPYEGGDMVVPKERLKYLAQTRSKVGELSPVDRLVREAYLEIYAGKKADLAKALARDDRQFVGIAGVSCEQIASYVRATLELDASLKGELRYYSGELKTSIRLPMSEGRAVNIGGSIDRVDRLDDGARGDMIRVIDYKTGADDISKSIPLPDLFDAHIGTTKSKVRLQTLLYCELISLGEDALSRRLQEAISQGVPMSPGAYVTRAIGAQRGDYNPFYRLELASGRGKDESKPLDYREVRDEFLEHLRTCLAELFDYDRPFEQTTALDSCKYCPFAVSCDRPSK